MKEVKKTKSESSSTKRKSNKVFNNVTEKKISDSSETSVSVFTKTTNPKVIIQSENVDGNTNSISQNKSKRKIIKFICFMVMCIIILITFFLSLKTYNTVNELSHYLTQN